MRSRSLISARWLLTVLAVAGLTVLAACAGQTNGPSTAKGEMAPPEQQVLRLRLQSEPKTIDPQLANQAQETSIIKSLFAGLFTYNEQLQVVPNLAKEMPTVANGGISKDGTTYTIKIKEDAKWSDGKPVTADDFVYGMLRALDPKTGSPYASFFHGIAGAKAYNTAMGTPADPKTPSDEQLAGLRAGVGVSARDEHTLVYQLVQPNPSFLNLLSLWTAFPVRRDIVEKYGPQWTEAGNHVGNGAFMLREWSHNERLVFVPNPFWSGEKPKLSRVELNFIADDVAAYNAYLAGDIDVVTVPPPSVREVRTAGSALNAQLIVQPNLATFALFMNNKVAPFDNQKVRQAFGTAIDRVAYVEGVLQGGGVPTTSWIPPGMPGYNPKIGEQYAFDPAKARKLLAEAGYPNGQGLPKVTFLMVANDTNRIVGQFVQDQLKKNLGVEVDVEYVEGRVYGATFTQNQHQVVIQRWNADWPYPDNWLPDLFATGALNNHANYSSSKFDDLVAKAAAEPDDRKRLSLYDDAHKLMVDEAGVVPLYNPVTYILVKPKVQDLVITGLDGFIKGDWNLHKTYIGSGD